MGSEGLLLCVLGICQNGLKVSVLTGPLVSCPVSDCHRQDLNMEMIQLGCSLLLLYSVFTSRQHEALNVLPRQFKEL